MPFTSCFWVVLAFLCNPTYISKNFNHPLTHSLLKNSQFRFEVMVRERAPLAGADVPQLGPSHQLTTCCPSDVKVGRRNHRRRSSINWEDFPPASLVHLCSFPQVVHHTHTPLQTTRFFSFIPALAALATVVAGVSLRGDETYTGSDIECGTPSSPDKRDLIQHPSRALGGWTNVGLLRRGLPINNPLRPARSCSFDTFFYLFQEF